MRRRGVPACRLERRYRPRGVNLNLTSLIFPTHATPAVILSVSTSAGGVDVESGLGGNGRMASRSVRRLTDELAMRCRGPEARVLAWWGGLAYSKPIISSVGSTIAPPLVKT